MTLPKFTSYALVFYIICSLTAMAPMNLSFAFVLCSYIFNLFSANHKVNLSDTAEFKTYRFWALALLITCWGSLIVTKIFPYAYADHAPEVTFHGFLKIWYLIIPAVLVSTFVGAEKSFSFEKLVKPWWWMTLVMFFLAVFQYFVGWPHSELIPDQNERYHANLFFGHHLSTSSILLFPTFTALAVSFGYFTRQKKLGKEKLLASASLISPKFALLIGVAGTMVLFLSYARTAWLALVIGFLFLIKKFLLHHFTRKQWISGIIAAIFVFGAFAQTPIIRDRLHKFYGVNERVHLWRANIDFFTHRPLTGIGWLKTQEMSEFYFKSIDPENYHGYFWGHAHSNFFEMLGGTGLLGLLAFFGWSIFTLRFAYQVSKKLESHSNFFYSDFAYGIFIALILLHFNGLTNVTFWEGKVMHQQMLAVGLLLILNRNSTTRSEN